MSLKTHQAVCIPISAVVFHKYVFINLLVKLLKFERLLTEQKGDLALPNQNPTPCPGVISSEGMQRKCFDHVNPSHPWEASAGDEVNHKRWSKAQGWNQSLIKGPTYHNKGEEHANSEEAQPAH